MELRVSYERKAGKHGGAPTFPQAVAPQVTGRRRPVWHIATHNRPYWFADAVNALRARARFLQAQEQAGQWSD